MPSPARPRHIAYSAKQKKEYLQLKRAMKRGEIDADETLLPKSNGRTKIDKTSTSRSEAVHDALELRSKFTSVPRDYVERTRVAAWDDELERPLLDLATVFPLELVDNPAGKDLTVPSRPAFHAGQSKREVEDAEEEEFRKWRYATREIVDSWTNGTEENENDTSSASTLRSPSRFEINIEVWRQLWRVIEASSIILLLVDSRCPPVHCPPSLRAYLRTYRPKREIVLVLTKSDLVDGDALERWEAWLRSWWDGEDGDEEVQVVAVSSYDTELLGDGRRKPEIAPSARAELIAALKTAHERLRRASNTPVQTIHWGELQDQTEIHIQQDPASSEDDSISPTHNEPLLTVGLVGQPNVGKSSLLNALLGSIRVQAHRTPGKTKHFQTMLWGARREVRIVDCPGLVFPSLVPMELQVMAGTLSIAQVPSLPACISFAALYIPLERALRLPEPEVVVDEMVAKRTWRKGMVVAARPPRGPRWTAGEIMDRRATDRGFVTARSARPDANRAADEILRSLADGRIRWGFWPPGMAPIRDGDGIYLGESTVSTSNDEARSATSDERSDSVEEEEIPSSDAESDEDDFTKANNASFFAALNIEDK